MAKFVTGCVLTTARCADSGSVGGPDLIHLPRDRAQTPQVSPDRFGHALLLRQWGRIGTEGRPLEPTPIPEPPSMPWLGSSTANGAAATRTAIGDQATHPQAHSARWLSAVQVLYDFSASAHLVKSS